MNTKIKSFNSRHQPYTIGFLEERLILLPLQTCMVYVQVQGMDYTILDTKGYNS